MHPDTVREIQGCLPTGKTPFHYFRDRYAALLLGWYVGKQGMPIHAIKRSAFSGLLAKTAIRTCIASCPDGILSADHMAACWPHPRDIETYRLTLGEWGTEDTSRDPEDDPGWHQTSRPGMNLVLQLNFSSKHDRPYEALIRPQALHPFECIIHPIAPPSYRTLAWARIDLELERGEALIEEIQNDWVRRVQSKRRVLQSILGGDGAPMPMPQSDPRIRRALRGADTDPVRFERYTERVLKPHMRLWDEAMLAATLWFLREEIGTRRIYYHTFAGGNALKGLDDEPPPRSLYTTLPKRFCFRPTSMAPSFLDKVATKRLRPMRAQREPVFFVLDL